MARAGLGQEWQCLFANDIDAKKGASYAANWGDANLKIEDVGKLRAKDVPGCADLAWASFPCQDLSLAGDYVGLKGKRSGTVWPFWRLMTALAREKREPRIIVLENVCGALTSHKGKDFGAIGAALAGGGYRFGALVINAIHFVPQSRPRLFIVGVRKDRTVAAELTSNDPDPVWHPSNLVGAYGRLSRRSKKAWVWWNLGIPSARKLTFGDVIEGEPEGVSWHSPAETRRLLGMMSRLNREKVQKAKAANSLMVGGIYKRTRRDEKGRRAQRAEIRFDDVSGCLRTPVGGSSRQVIMIVKGNVVRSRLLAPREAARLMGLPDSYKLPVNYNEAYHVCGDGVVVPVVRFLAAHILEPLLGVRQERSEEVA